MAVAIKNSHERIEELIQLTLNASENTNSMFDLLLSKKRAPDRKAWLEKKGNLAEV